MLAAGATASISLSAKLQLRKVLVRAMETTNN